MPIGQPPAVEGVIDGVMAAARGLPSGPPWMARQAVPVEGARMTGSDSDPDVDYSR